MKSIDQLKEELKEAKRQAYKDAKTQQDVLRVWEQDKRTGIPKEAKRLFCYGCRDNYYNGVGASECWCLEKAKLRKRKIYQSLDSTKPEEVITLNCYQKEYHP